MKTPRSSPREDEILRVRQHLSFLQSVKNVTAFTLYTLRDKKILLVVFVKDASLVADFSRSVPNPSVETSWKESRRTLKRLFGLQDSISLMPEGDNEERLSVDLRPDPRVSHDDVIHRHGYTRSRVRKTLLN